jgi:uncharacterized lipoprotein YajG
MMHVLRLAVISLAVTACQDQQVPVTAPLPPPIQNGVAAYVTVDNLTASQGQAVRVRVEVQVGTQQNFKLGSFTGRLHFNPALLQFKSENAISDGLRVANALNATHGEIRFAGASAMGFTTLVLYDGTFEVKGANYAADLALQMEELSAATSLTNLRAQLKVSPQVFLSAAATRP